jgi:hypothetical protein
MTNPTFIVKGKKWKGDGAMKGASRKKGTKLLWCDQCKGNYCLKGYAEVKPNYRRAANDADILESIPGKYVKPETARFHKAASSLMFARNHI